MRSNWPHEFAARRSMIDARLADIAASVPSPAPLRNPLQRALSLGGKRVRGILVLAAAEAAGGKGEQVLDAAAALEMIHSSSLILDDLPPMDDALQRRGAPALHREFGEDLAILAAVALLNHGYEYVIRNHAATAPRRWPLSRVLQRLIDAVGWDGSVAGEAVDLHSEGSQLDFGTLEFIHARKTGALFGAAAAIGCMLANAQAVTLKRVEIYAKNLGLAFQITDDVLDATGSPGVLGKDVGKDAHRLTFVKLAGVDGARALSNELAETAIDALLPLGETAEPLRVLAMMVRDRVR